MDTVEIRQAIAMAKTHERETRELEQLLHGRLHSLHHSISLPEQDAVNCMIEFITRYIDHVPQFLDAIQQVADSTEITDYTDPIINICTEFFVHPPEMLAGHRGLDALMDESYLAHRLVEELNDRFISYFRTPLVPFDMTRSNLIVHHLIGENFANQLDLAIHLVVDHLAEHEYILASKPATSAGGIASAWQALQRSWPCLTDNLAISLLVGKRYAAVH